MFSLNYPLNIQVETTENCDHQCFYCYNSWRASDSKNQMSEENAGKLVQIIEKDLKPFSVTITGGEPLMNMPVTLLLVREIGNMGKFYNLNTNLILLDEEKIDLLKRAAGKTRFGVMASLPHYEEKKFKEITGKKNSSKFFRNLTNLVENHSDLYITINMVVHKLNKDWVYDEGKLLAEKYGIKSFAATPMLIPSFGRGREMALDQKETVKVLEDLLRLHKDTGIKVDSVETIPLCLIPEEIRNNNLGIFNRACSAGRSTLNVGYDGSVRACSHSPFSSGNLFEENFRKIWERFKPFRENEFVPEECRECVELSSCNGGCRFNDYQEGEQINRKDPRMLKRITIKKQKRKELPGVDFNRNYLVSQNILYREEKEGLYSFFNGDFSNILFVNEGFKNFILYLVREKEINFSNIQVNKEYEKKVQEMFQILIDRKYLR